MCSRAIPGTLCETEHCPVILSQAADVFAHNAGDFMQDAVGLVDKLLAKGVMTTVYNGQVDLRSQHPDS